MFRVQLYEHQASLIRNAYDALKSNNRVCVQSPTGSGKTVMFSHVMLQVMNKKKRGLVLVHRRELIWQAVEKLNRLGIQPGVILSGVPFVNRPVIVASIQTLSNRDLPEADVVIIDEAHHAVAETYKGLMNHYPRAKILGFTATPCRLGGNGLGDVFEKLVVGPGVRWLINNKFLSDYKIYHAPLQSEISTVKKTGGDYNHKMLAAFVEKNILRGDLVDSYKSLVPGESCLLYATNLDLSRQYVNEYNRAGIKSAHVDGSTDKKERQRIFMDFAEKKILVLSSVGVATEGIDVPNCTAIQIVRPTASLALHLQIMGRGLRYAEGKTCTFLDHSGNVLKHGTPEEEMRWNLDKKKTKTVKLDELVKVVLPGMTDGVKNKIEHNKMIQLVKFERPPEPPDLKRLKDLVSLVEEKQYMNKSGKLNYYWAYSKWKEKLERKPNAEELKFFAKKSGYHHGWIKHQS